MEILTGIGGEESSLMFEGQPIMSATKDKKIKMYNSEGILVEVDSSMVHEFLGLLLPVVSCEYGHGYGKLLAGENENHKILQLKEDDSIKVYNANGEYTWACFHTSKCHLYYEERPNLWARFWQRVLFGWRWVKCKNNCGIILPDIKKISGEVRLEAENSIGELITVMINDPDAPEPLLYDNKKGELVPLSEFAKSI